MKVASTLRLHSEIETKLLAALERARAERNAWIEAISLHSTYVQLIFVFAALINLIQNGPVSKAHKKLAATLTAEDVVITFNWDTLMERALAESTNWTLDQGYGFEPHLIYRNSWEKPRKRTEDFGKPTVLKLHGSSNWITSYPIIDSDTKKLSLMQTAPADRVSIYECTLDPYSTYDGRYMPGYERYSYGYYPPNLPDDPGKSARKGHVFARVLLRTPWIPGGHASDKGLVSSPLIIPPVQHKTYTLFGPLFTDLWKRAESTLRAADEIALIGYSFPPTDVQSLDLFKKALCGRSSIPQITVCNPDPTRALEILSKECGVTASHVRILSEASGYFTEDFDCGRLWQ